MIGAVLFERLQHVNRRIGTVADPADVVHRVEFVDLGRIEVDLAQAEPGNEQQNR